MTVVGIDLGTTNSVVATVDDAGKIEVLANAVGECTTPSVVYFNGDTVFVGASAQEEGMLDPDNAVRLIKRHMGTDFPLWFEGRQHTPESISALILTYLVSALPGPVRAVVTVPAYFGTAEREATFAAGALVGLEVLEVLDEPVAAAMYHGLVSGGDRCILVYDLGGGTFDATVLRISGSSVEVVATDGHNALGGADVDERLVETIVGRLEAMLPTEDFERTIEEQLGRLLVEIETAKRSLAVRETRGLGVATPRGRVSMSLSRDDLDLATADLRAATFDKIRAVREAAATRGVTTIDEVIMVGGSSRLPMLVEGLQEALGHQPRLIEPDLAVAKGAAIRAHQILGTSQYATWASQRTHRTQVGEPVASVATVLPRAVGVLVHDSFDPAGERRFVDHLVLANTRIPTSVTKTFATIVEEQSSVRIQVYEQAGSSLSAELSHNRMVIDGEMTGLTPGPAGSLVDVRVHIAGDGRVDVSGMEKRTGKELRLEAFMAGVVDSSESTDLKAQLRSLTVRG